MPRMSVFVSSMASDSSRRVVDAKVDHFKARAFHHHGDKVLADVVDVAFDRADDHLPDAWRACFGQAAA